MLQTLIEFCREKSHASHAAQTSSEAHEVIQERMDDALKKVMLLHKHACARTNSMRTLLKVPVKLPQPRNNASSLLVLLA